MKVIEHLDRATNPLFSYEIIPPKRGRSIRDILSIVDVLAPLNPPFIDVTSHAASIEYYKSEDGSGLKRKSVRKRPGTLGICGIIQNRYNIDTVAHILCSGFTKEETEDALIELHYLGIENVLALKGDDAPSKVVAKDRGINTYALDLVEQLSLLKQGKFVNEMEEGESINFCIGVAGYPEKHFEAPNKKQDLLHLKNKVDAGADYIVTQMFYDNKPFFEFQKSCQEMDINVPIIPGLKVITSVKQLSSIPKKFFIDFPDELVDEVMSNQKHVKEIGLRHALKQAEELLNNGSKGIHFYIMNNPTSITEIVKKLNK